MLSRACGWCGVALLALAAPLQAQSKAGVEAGGGWLLSLHANENYSDDIGLGSTAFESLRGGQRSGFITHLGATVSRTFQRADSKFRLEAKSLALFHAAGLSDLNRLVYNAGASYSRPLSARTTFDISDAYTSTYTHLLLDDFADEGLLHPLAGIRRNQAAIDYRYQISQVTNIHASVKHSLFFFEDDPELVDGWRLGTSMGLSRQFTEDKSGSINLGYGRSGRSDTPADSYSAGLSWTQTLGRTLGLALDAGAAQVRAGDESKTVFAGGGSLVGSWRLGQGNVTGGYNRFIRMAGGSDRVRLVDVVHLSYKQKLFGELGFGVQGAYARNRDPFDSNYKYESMVVGVGLHVSLTRKLNLGGTYGINRRVVTGRANLGQRIGLSLSYSYLFGGR